MVTVPQSLNFNTLLRDTRESISEVVFKRRRRCLFYLMDQILSEDGVNPALLSVESRVSHTSFYEALHEGEIDAHAATSLCIHVGDTLGMPRVYAIDQSNIEKKRARTSPERVKLHGSGLSRISHHTMVGWKVQVVSRLNDDADAWSLPVKVDFLYHEDSTTDLTLREIHEITRESKATPEQPDLFLLDAGYPVPVLDQRLHDQKIPAVVLGRLSKSQVFYTDPGAYRGTGRPRTHGEKFSPINREPSDPLPNASLSYIDSQYGRVSIEAWTNVHKKNPMESHPEGSVILIKVEKLRRGFRNANMLLWASSREDPLQLSKLLHQYLRRFDIEHLFRLAKHNMGLTQYHAEQPESFLNWAWCVLLGIVQLYIARSIVKERRHPWERKRQRLSPPRVLRVVSLVLCTSFQMHEDPRKHRAGPGRPVGSRKARKVIHPIVKKGPKKQE